MFLIYHNAHGRNRSFLCMRRDVSTATAVAIAALLFSLHAQRCFLVVLLCSIYRSVFSACAEMFPQYTLHRHAHWGFLCMRRDVSKSDEEGFRRVLFSLHAQRCFCDTHDSVVLNHVFSACAEMFPVLHSQDSLGRQFSLHAQRCFLYSFASCSILWVFSACAEMFPTVVATRCW